MAEKALECESGNLAPSSGFAIRHVIQGQSLHLPHLQTRGAEPGDF